MILQNWMTRGATTELCLYTPYQPTAKHVPFYSRQSRSTESALCFISVEPGYTVTPDD